MEFGELKLLVQGAVVAGHVGEVKTRYSHKRMPLDPALAEALLDWRTRRPFNEDKDWVFASPFQAGLPPSPWGIQERHIVPAAKKAELGPGIGWHISPPCDRIATTALRGLA